MRSAGTVTDDIDRPKEDLIRELNELRLQLKKENAMTYDLARMLTDHDKEASLLLDNLPLYVFIKDTNGVTLAANKKLCDALGLCREDVVGKTAHDLFPKDIAEKHVADDLKVLRSGETLVTEEDFTASGRHAVVETRKVPLKDDKGNVIGLIGIADDITGRKKIHEALRKSERFMSNVFNCIQDGISILDRDLNIVRTNHVMEEWHPYMMPLVGKKCYFAYHSQTEPCEICPSMSAMNKNMMQNSVVPFSGETGQRGWLEIYSYPVRDDAGGVVGVVEHVRDVTERMKIEEALQRSEEKFRGLVEKISDMVWETNDQSVFTYVSPNVFDIFGLSTEEVLGKTLYDFLTKDEVTRAMEVLKPIVAARKPIRLVQVRYVTIGGDKYIELSGDPIFDHGGMYRGYRGTAREITERKRVEDELADSKAQAELYVDLMAHDINNMNQITMGFLELAQNLIEYEGKLSADNLYLLEKAVSSLKNSSQLIDSVRKLQREKMGMYEPKILDVDRIIGSVIEGFNDIPGRDITINFAADHGYMVKANDLLKDLFINLIGNAIKHSQGPLNIDISTCKVIEDGRTYIRVTVDDDGPGIPDSLKNTLFDRLNLASTRARGKGFGLCLIKLLVDDYGGKFRAEDRVPGDYTKGARFVVLLPALEDP